MVWYILLGLILLNPFLDGQYGQGKKRKSGDIIYQWNRDKTRIKKYKAYGESICRPMHYRRFNFPFQSRWKEIHNPAELDFCTGEVYYKGKWTYFDSLIDDETAE